MGQHQLKKTFIFHFVLMLIIIGITNGTNEPSSAINRALIPYQYDENVDSSVMTSDGPEDDHREPFYDDDDDEDDDTSYVVNDDDEDGTEEADATDTAEKSNTGIEKRNLGALARQGDAAARRIHAPFALTPYTYNDPDIWSQSGETIRNSEKRNIGSLAKGGFYKLRYSGQRPNGFSRTSSWNSKPKRFYTDDENLDQEFLSDTENSNDPYSMVKRNIASLARKGSLTQLRMQRRPIPWISDEDYEYNDRMHTHDGYKRNIQNLARIATPGSGFRSWLRGRLHSPSSPDNKRRFHGRFGMFLGEEEKGLGGLGGGGGSGGRYSLFGRGRLGVRDRFRGVRSTRYMNNIVQGSSSSSSPSYRSGFRAPMAFVSRHIWKRAIGDVLQEALLRHQMTTQDTIDQQKNRGPTTTQSPLDKHNTVNYDT